MFLQMANWWATPEPDESFLKFRERSLRDGAWLTYVVAFVVAVYAVATWHKPHRDAILGLLAIAVFGGWVMTRLPAAALMRSRWREPFFLVWTTADLILIALVVASDRGDWSPLRATFFLPLFFAALSYPARSVMATGGLAILAYIGAAELGGHATGEALGVFSALLATATVMGVSQAVNRDRQRGELQTISRSDPLTGCLNRRGFTERFAAELADHVRHDGRPLGLIVIDLDDFKRVNDTRGHAAGDDLLCEVARTLAGDLRPSDVLGRLGGDEFAVLLPEAGPGELRAAAARLEQRLGAVAAASIGLAALPADGLTAEDLHRAADADLYRTKQRRAERAIAATV
jgi:diguanylate cyclase (GGDEF)-like protein